ncbi:glycosyltransferase family protein [Sulfitobacter maritimus]|uniref:glycosyltransferase family protein n=1 Tax=Sulfitobacter maritimus TaxID=2741719 RepID=UPI001C2EF40C|nr:glycosyltransferase [Sulfitobacter maritimus]
MIVVTHLLGSGHLARALILARAFQHAGHSATVVSGGIPVPVLDRGDVPLVQLPPLRSDGVNFTQLLEDSGAPVSHDTLSARKALLLQQFAEIRPDVLITELYPFGRRVLRDEFTAVLKAADKLADRPLICASVRDILAPPSSPQKADKSHSVLARYYDAVLVHADPHVMPLDASWPVLDALRSKLHYTGFMAPAVTAPLHQTAGVGEIIVSAGGGDVGAQIFDTALRAAQSDPRVWRVLIGGAQARIAQLRAKAPANVIVEATRPDFRALLHQAAASVSMCGYNTAIDVLQAGCRSVFIPFDAGAEVEQTIRATALAQLPGIEVLRSADLTPDRLLSALSALDQSPHRAPATDGFDGARETVRRVASLWAQMP